MLCYKDMTFCREKECRNWEACARAMTKEREKAAGEWWEQGGGLPEDAPVCYFSNAPECFQTKGE